MDISIVGTGYVGLVTGICLADKGHRVYCVDIDLQKIEKLNDGELTIYEPGLQELLIKNLKENRLFFSTNLALALENTDVCYIAVGTPSGDNKEANLKYVFQVAKEIGSYINKDMYIVSKSTVPVGTHVRIKEIIKNELEQRNLNLDFQIISNPEFLREGTAVKDFLEPDRIIIGAENEKSMNIMREIYRNIVSENKEKLIEMDIRSAEMTKYAANAFLATKISFINEISNICERLGANINMVRKGIGSDHRIGGYFIEPGCGYGGSCFPKDVEALIELSISNGYEPKILNTVEKVNLEQKKLMPEKICGYFGDDLTNIKIGIWGLAFKPNTDDAREASAIIIIEELLKHGCEILAYDPKAIENIKNYLKDNSRIKFVDDKYEAAKDVDALVLVTEWDEFIKVDFTLIRDIMKQKVIFDGRNKLNGKKLKEIGFEYYGIGGKDE